MSDTLQDRLRKLSTENPGPRDCIDEAADKIDELTNNEREYSRLIGMSYQECRDLLDTQSKRIAELEAFQKEVLGRPVLQSEWQKLEQEVARLSAHIRAIAEHHNTEIQLWRNGALLHPDERVEAEAIYHAERRDFALAALTSQTPSPVDQFGASSVITPEYVAAQEAENQRARDQLDAAGDQTAANPMIQAALDNGEDATGLCTVREAVAMMRESNHNPMELSFVADDEATINVELKILRVCRHEDIKNIEDDDQGNHQQCKICAVVRGEKSRNDPMGQKWHRRT